MPEIADSLNQHSGDSISLADSSGITDILLNSGKNVINIFTSPEHKHFDGHPINHSENIWQFSFLMGMLILIAILTSSFGNRMSSFLKAVTGPRYLRQLMREEGFLIHPFSLLLLVNACVVYALITYKAFHFYTSPGDFYHGILFFLILFAGIFLLLITKIFFMRILEFLTDTDLGQRENRYTWIMFHQMAGLILFPITGIVLFGKEFWVLPGLILSISILIILLIFRVGKGLYLAMGNKVYHLHIFLYLCTLEIIPLVVLIKVLMSQIKGFNE